MRRKRLRLPDFALKLAFSKTGRFLSKAEILGVGVFSPLSSKSPHWGIPLSVKSPALILVKDFRRSLG